MRLGHAATGDDRRVRRGHLQRCRLEVALTDGEVDVVADRPVALVGDEATRAFRALLAGDLALVDLRPPRAIRDQALDLARQVDARAAAEAEAVRPRLERLVRQCVE